MITSKRMSFYFSFVRSLLVPIAFLAMTTFLVAQSPVGEWKFDEGSGNIAFDASGNGNAAQLSNGIRWAHSIQGWAVSASNTNRGVVSTPPIDLSATRATTISAWINRSYSGDEGVLIQSGRNDIESNSGFALLPDDETCHGLRAVLHGNGGLTANCYAQPSSGVWHHLAVVFDKSQTGGDQISLYVDGVAQSPTWNLASAANTDNFGSDPLYLFSRAGISQFSSGTVRDLRIYDRALTDGEIQQIYAGSPQQLAPALGIRFVQGNYATPQTPQTTVNVRFNAAQTAGDLNVVVVGWNDSTATVSRVVDSKGNTYTRAVGPTVQSGYGTQSIYYAKNIAAAASGTNTVTVTFSTGAVSPDIRILEYSGADPNNPVDVTSASSGSSTLSNSGMATTTNATDLIFGANLVQTLTTGPGVNFTSRILTVPDGDIAEDTYVAATGSYSATAPVRPSGPWIMQMVAFRTPATGSFTISASPSSLSVAQGRQGTSTITTAVSGGFNSAITLSASGVPSGTTLSFSPNPIAAPGSGSSTMTITVGSTTPMGTYPIIVTGNGGGVQQSTTVTLTVIAAASFTISASPSSLSVSPGHQGLSTITTAVTNGFNSSITLSSSGVPTGTTVSFSPNPISAPGSGSSTMTIAVGSGTPTGTYPITVTGNGGGVQQSTTVTLTVAIPTFTISASPSSLSIAQGRQGTSTITTAVSGGFNSAITLSASGVPSGTTLSFGTNPIPAPGSGSSIMTITVGSTTPMGTYPIIVTGNGGGVQQSTTVTLTVTAAASFTISASPSSLSIAQGRQGTSTITTAVSGGFNSSITLSASGVPSGTTLSFGTNPIPAPGSGSSIMTITVGSTTPMGTYPITVTGNGGGVQQSTTVTLTVTAAPSFTISASPSSLTVSPGNQGLSTITTAVTNGFNSSVTLSSSGVPTGTTVSFSPNPIPAPGSGSSTMTITVGSGTPAGTYPITVTGNGGGAQQSTTVTLTVVIPTFTISASPSSLTIAAGTQGTSTITTAISGGFNSAISLSASGAPTGTTVAFNPSTIPAPGSGTSTMTITVGTGTSAGTYPITITGIGGGVQQNTVVTLTVTRTVSTITYVQGNYATPQSPQTTVSVVYSAAQNAGDLNVVSLGWNDSTATVTSVADSSGNQYTRAVGPTVVSGYCSQSIYYAKNIRAAGAGANTVTITFSTAAVAPDIRILEYNGADVNSPVDVTAANSGNSSSTSSGSATTTNPTDLIFGANLVLTTTGGPGSGFTSRMITQPDGDIAEDQMTSSAGSYSATAPLTSSGWWIMQMVAFRTQGTGSFTISAAPSSLSIAQAHQGTSTITTAISGGFNNSIALSASGVPSGTTVSFSPNPIAAPGSGSSTMTISVGATTPAGTYPITVTGNGGGIQQDTTVTLTVTVGPGFSVSASPSSLSVMQETQGLSTISVSVSGGFNSSVSLSASGTPSGTTVTFNPATLPAPGSGTSTMTITVGTTPEGTYPITVTAMGGGVQQTATVNLTVTAEVMLTWTASQSPGIAGYNVYRGTTSGGPYTKINSSLDTTTAYNDLAVQDGVTYYYVTTAVSNQGQESSYSNQSSATVP